MEDQSCNVAPGTWNIQAPVFQPQASWPEEVKEHKHLLHSAQQLINAQHDTIALLGKQLEGVGFQLHSQSPLEH
eukprot:10195822-Karenia_brevis.AAC.1